MSEPTREERTRRAGEAMEDASVRWLGRDLGTVHRDDIAQAALDAAGVWELVAERDQLRERAEKAEAACEVLSKALRALAEVSPVPEESTDG